MIVVLGALFLLLQVGQGARLVPAWVHSWGDDLLCLPLILGGILWAQRHVAGQGAGYILPRAHGVGVLLLIGVFFELIWPRVGAGAVADPWDLVAYTLGFFFFQRFINRPGAVRPASA